MNRVTAICATYDRKTRSYRAEVVRDAGPGSHAVCPGDIVIILASTLALSDGDQFAVVRLEERRSRRTAFSYKLGRPVTVLATTRYLDEAREAMRAFS
jgi:predicted glutamine amidotransferase